MPFVEERLGWVTVWGYATVTADMARMSERMSREIWFSRIPETLLVVAM